jgi:trehalose-6-phosphate synthase
LIVNPFDIDAVADALHRGLIMPLAERRERWEALYRTLRSNTIDHWCDSFLRALTGGDDTADGFFARRNKMISASARAVLGQGDRK